MRQAAQVGSWQPAGAARSQTRGAAQLVAQALLAEAPQPPKREAAASAARPTGATVHGP